MSSSHMRAEKALDDFLQSVQSKSETAKSRTAITAINEESMDVAWPQLITALQDYGLDHQTANENRLFIVDWLVGAMMDGLLPADEAEPEHDSTSSSSYSSDGAFSPMEQYASSESDPDEYPGVLDEYFPRKSPSSPISVDELKYMKPFGQLGRVITKEVRWQRSTFKADINRAREYWKRGDWPEVKSYLLRILVAAQNPTHRQSDISPRTTAYLLGIAYSNSGELDTAIDIMCSVLTPFNKEEISSGPYDEGHIAAATWLGDLCLKTNRIESAALAWAMAYHAANLRSTRLSKGHPAYSDGSSGSNHSRSSSGSDSSSIFPRPLENTSQRPRSLSRTFRLARAQAMAILNRLASVNRRIRNLDALSESLASGWDPDQADHVFAKSQILSRAQMQYIATKARGAIETAAQQSAANSSRSSPRHSRSRERNCSDPKPLPNTPQVPPRRAPIFTGTGGRAAAEEISLMLTPVEDALQSPVRSSEWPLSYDVRFSRSAAVKTINWFYSFTPLELEEATCNIPTLDVRQYRSIYPGIEKPMFLSGKLDTRKTEDSTRFISTLQRMLKTLGFEYLEEPSVLRCRPRTDRSSRWPTIACFAVHIIKYKPDGFKKAPKFAAYISDVMHWNGQTENFVVEHAETKLLIEDMSSTLLLLDMEDRKLGSPAPRRSPTVVRPRTSRQQMAGGAFMLQERPQKLHISGPTPIAGSMNLTAKAIESPW